MTQIKLFKSSDYDGIEERVNQFLKENADCIKVIDIKHTTVSITYANFFYWTAMIIYEKLH